MAKRKSIRIPKAFEEDFAKGPIERQKELDERMKKFLENGGVIEVLPPGQPTKDQLKSWKI